MILYTHALTKADQEYCVLTQDDAKAKALYKDYKLTDFEKSYDHLSRQVRTIVNDECTAIRFVYFEVDRHENNYKGFYEVVTLVYSKDTVMCIVETNKRSQQRIEKEGFLKFTYASMEEIVYHVLDSYLILMADTLYTFEDEIRDIENEIMRKHHDGMIQEIISVRNIAYRIKRYMHLSLFLGDDLLLNENKLMREDAVALFAGFDSRLNRTAEYANVLFEGTNHLRETYDSTVNAHTNTLINKLTVFTVIATPATVLTGIYGMNFKYMPGLDHPWGYPVLLLTLLAISAGIYFVLKKSKLL